MKTYITFFLLLLFNCAIAQQLPVLTTTSFTNNNDDFKHAKNGNYAMDVDNERNQYVGTWEYNQNGILFQVKIEKIDQYLNKVEYNGEVISYNYSDVVTFKYKLIKNGITLYNNLNTIFADGANIPIAYKKINSNLYGEFLDYSGNVMARIEIEKLNTNPEKIIFNNIVNAYYLLSPPDSYTQGQQLFYIPTEPIEMVKIN